MQHLKYVKLTFKYFKSIKRTEHKWSTGCVSWISTTISLNLGRNKNSNFLLLFEFQLNNRVHLPLNSTLSRGLFIA